VVATYAAPMKRHAPATERNQGPIGDVLARVLPARGTVLEIASGTGQHAVAFARRLPEVTWQPSDVDPDARASVAAHAAEAGLPNLRPPIEVDASAPAWVDGGGPGELDAIVCINMIHIAPWPAALGLFAGAGRRLPAGGVLVLYGPYRFGGGFTAPSNEAFDRSLRARDPRWGVRDVTDLEAAAAAHGLILAETVALPANNHVLVFRRAAPAQ
jgi:SAM-dependent methyltransferase